MRNKFSESNQILQSINKTNYLFQQLKNADASIFQIYLLKKFQGPKKGFYEIFYCCITVLFNEKG